MDVNYLIQVLERKIIILNNAKANAFSVGDLDTLNAVDQELLAVQSTLVQLNLLASVTQAAAASNSTATDMLTAAIQASQSQSSAYSAADIVNGYDISTYATDPSFEQNINNILMAMPAFASAADIDAYIQGIAPGSPVTGNMVVSAATTYNVDEPLLVALMQNDSQFGTQGVAVSTLNPGNIGNTGSATQTYASWQDGVSAVAAWLANHRAVVPDAPTPTAVAAITPESTSTDTAASSTPASDAPTEPASSSTVAPAVSTTTPNTSNPVAASSTPSVVSDATSTAATSTPSISTIPATTTPAIAATSTAETSSPLASTSTPPIIDASTSSTTPVVASSTTPVIPASTASSTPESSTNASSTPSTSTSATSTSSSGN